MPRKLPWFAWYANDWLSDEGLRACSLEARGLWIDLLCLMHKNVRRGYLQLDGKAPTPEQAARMTGCSAEEFSRTTAELISAGVASVTDTGIIFSRKMVRDQEKREKCSLAGKRGGGNPSLTFKGDHKGEVKGEVKGRDKHACDCDISEFREEERGCGGGEGEKIAFEGFDKFWHAYPKKVRRAAAMAEWRNMVHSPELFTRILAAVEAHKKTDDWKDARFIPYPNNWLAEERWNDEIVSQNGHCETVEQRAARVEAQRQSAQHERNGTLSSEEVRKNLEKLKARK